jgi:cell division protein FtsB
MTTPHLSSPPIGNQIRRNSRLIGVGALVLCLLFVAGYVQRSADKAAVEAEMSALQVEIAQARVKQAVLQDELEQIEQPRAIDAAARNDLGLILRGDQPIVVLEPPAAAAPVPPPVAAEPLAPADAPDWLDWLGDIFSFGQ